MGVLAELIQQSSLTKKGTVWDRRSFKSLERFCQAKNLCPPAFAPRIHHTTQGSVMLWCEMMAFLPHGTSVLIREQKVFD